MQLSFPVHALLAATALLAASLAHAASTATSTLSDFHIVLTDLDPSDGAAPSVTLDPQSRSTVSASATLLDAVTSWTQQGDSAFGAVSAGGELDGSGGSASFAGDPFGAGADIVASATGGPSLAVGTSAAYIATPPDLPTEFVLSAHTQVTLWGYTIVDWNADTLDAAAFGEIDLGLRSDRDDITLDYATAGYYGDGYGPLSGSTPGVVTVTYANDSDASVPVDYYVGVFSNAGELEMALPPVDEPAGAGLLFAGLSLFWLVRRRR